MKRWLVALLGVALLASVAIAEKDSGDPFKLKSIAPNLMVDDMKGEIAFWKALGFEVEMTMPDEPPFNWVDMKSDDFEVMLQSRASLEGEENIPQDWLNMDLGGTLVFYLQVPNAAKVFQILSETMTVHRELYDTDYGMTEFVLISPNNYVVVIASQSAQ